ncbi:hypothetical protein CN359_31005, partial [Bacillus thuringiensis]|uniref:hypothetical protein n=1 Tax=Bacillus thuringiensis TaxID=1428 RepID=UPI000BFB10B5
HSSLYEDIDAFNKDYNNKLAEYTAINNKNKYLDNIIFVGNNLKYVHFCNIVVAAKLAATPINKYPDFDDEDTDFIIDYK